MKIFMCILLALLLIIGICITMFTEEPQFLATTEVANRDFVDCISDNKTEKKDLSVLSASMCSFLSASNDPYIQRHLWFCIGDEIDTFLKTHTIVHKKKTIITVIHRDEIMQLNDEIRQFLTLNR